MTVPTAVDSVPSSTTVEQAASRAWDVVVLGAGPAGALAARELACQHMRVLLLDKTAFPRSKVCGCCLNHAALETLTAVGLRDVPANCGAIPYEAIELSALGRLARLPLPTGAAVSRARLDAALASEAVAAGADFLGETTALGSKVDGSLRTVSVRHRSERFVLSARVVLLASGLGSDPGNAGNQQVARHSRIGLGGVVPGVPARFQDASIHMACGKHAYVGLVQVEDDCLNIAAALDADWLTFVGGPGHAVEAVLRSCALPVPPDLAGVAWKGTPALTRRRTSVAGERLLVVGDAAGYVEPFTGEGMSWALTSAVLVAPLAAQGVRHWHTDLQDQWRATHRTVIGRRQRLCRWLSWSLRRPRLVRLAISLMRRRPSLAKRVIRSINATNTTDLALCRPDVHQTERLT